MGQIRVSVIINTLDRANSLERTLIGLSQLRYPLFEVVVVHGPCRDHTDQVLARFAATIRIGDCPEANLSMSRNIGIAMARGDVVAFLDDDAVPEPDWLDRLVTGFRDADVGAVGGFIRDHDGVRFQYQVVVADWFGDARKFAAQPEQLGQHRYLSPTGTNVAFRRDALIAIGGFDEEFAYFLDETDVNLRLSDSAWRLVLVPEAEVHHKFAESRLRTPDRVPRSLYLIARSKAYFCWVNALEWHFVPEIEAHLKLFRWKEQRRMLRFRRAGKITARDQRRLTAEIKQGIADGSRAGRSVPRQRLLPKTTEAYTELPIFKPFAVRGPAETRLRICLLSPKILSEYPGGEIGSQTLRTAIELVERGHEVTVIGLVGGPKPYVDFTNGVWQHGVVASRVPISRRNDFPAVLRPYRQFAVAVAGEIDRVRPRRQFDLLAGPLAEVAAVRALRRVDMPIITIGPIETDVLEQRMTRLVKTRGQRLQAPASKETLSGGAAHQGSRSR